jgi:lipopolysaccharide transport system permease protein
MSTVITGERSGLADLKELSRYAGLLRYLSLRDVFVRYKQTWMGFAWSVVRPLVNIAIFGTVSILIDRGADVTSRFLEVSAAIIFWQLISTATTEVSNSLAANSNILTKVYFPKIVLPLSSLLVSLIDFAIGFVIYFVILVATAGIPPVQALLLPVVILYGMVFAFSIGLLAATASVKYRDVKFILPFLLQILFYVSPIVISAEFVLTYGLPYWAEVIYQLNPLVFIISAFKYCLVGSFPAIDPTLAMVSAALTLLVTVAAVRYFVRFERSFADYI